MVWTHNQIRWLAHQPHSRRPRLPGAQPQRTPPPPGPFPVSPPPIGLVSWPPRPS